MARKTPRKPSKKPKIRRFLHYIYDPERAERAVRFIENCCYLAKGEWAGKPLRLRPWQKAIVREIFGWIDPSTGFRRYRKVFIFLPRKNGKSHLGAAIALYLLFGDGEAGAEVVCAANSREQGSILFKAASEMVVQSPYLADEGTVLRGTKRILSVDGTMKVIAAEANTTVGQDLHGVFYDEVAFATAREFYDALTTSGGSRRQPLQIYITTASWEIGGIGHQLYNYAKSVANDPKVDPRFLPVIYELDKNADWSDETLWQQANPALYDFLNVEELRDGCREAINNVASQGKFRMFHGNQWVSAADAWLNPVKWAKCEDPEFDERDLEGRPCHLGIDLSSKIDLAALAAMWELSPRRYYLKLWFFLPDADLRERILRDHVPYDAWAEQKMVTLTPGDEIDYQFIRVKVNELRASYQVRSIGYDPWNADAFIQQLKADGWPDDACIPIRQGPQSLGEPSKEFEAAINSGRVSHGSNECMDWNVANVSVREDANGNIVPCKRKSRHRIDGVAASINALDRCLRAPLKKKGSLRVHVLG